MSHRPTDPGAYDAIYGVVARIPRGRVATYGQVARLAGRPTGARQVGYALAALRSGTRIPWHRVVNARGAVSLRDPGCASQQRYLLEKEGVPFGAGGRVDFDTCRWDGGESRENGRTGFT